ncbi:hypothetical protein [Bacteroidetes bacterium endosymbiont of Geopemphigus sp.]|uniref:hypothetical protein n=1 Tax=Bacteroidetes bacterium endosymbiont of Geopemphigus sp. TaxID=2047937 RepID=UPI000CD2ADBC|nr:hypothetical protein [Bacteroidetes bacterium endosymbiont of Geopemphigus sp.]
MKRIITYLSSCSLFATNALKAQEITPFKNSLERSKLNFGIKAGEGIAGISNFDKVIFPTLLKFKDFTTDKKEKIKNI